MKTILLFLLLTQSALADGFTIGSGISQFKNSPDGQWREDKNYHDINLRSPSATIRYDVDRYSIGYMYTGKVTSFGIARASDETIRLNHPYPNSHWYGKGKSEGIFATMRFGSKWYATFGPMLYRSTWDVYIPDWHGCSDWPTPCLVPMEAMTKTATHQAKWIMRPIGGVGYQNKTHAIELNLIPTAAYGDSFPAVYRGYATNITMFYKF